MNVVSKISVIGTMFQKYKYISVAKGQWQYSVLTLPLWGFWVMSAGRIMIILKRFTYLRLRGAGSEVKGNICPEKCKRERKGGEGERKAKLAGKNYLCKRKPS